jgi:diamine N-acetyltransferase
MILSLFMPSKTIKAIWAVSNTHTPYSRFLVKQYLENAQQDIYEAKQLRLAFV